MPNLSARSPKVKITVTLSSDLVRQIDQLLDSAKASSRSQLVEEAVRAWLHDQAQKENRLANDIIVGSNSCGITWRRGGLQETPMAKCEQVTTLESSFASAAPLLE